MFITPPPQHPFLLHWFPSRERLACSQSFFSMLLPPTSPCPPDFLCKNASALAQSGAVQLEADGGSGERQRTCQLSTIKPKAGSSLWAVVPLNLKRAHGSSCKHGPCKKWVSLRLLLSQQMLRSWLCRVEHFRCRGLWRHHCVSYKIAKQLQSECLHC